MPKVPLEIAQTTVKQQKKLMTKDKDKMIFSDKIVNKRTQPTLYNVQSAATALQTKIGTVSLRASRKSGRIQKNLPRLSLETLMEMNVALDPLPQDFTLLQQISLVLPDPNPYIMDAKLIDSIENAPVSARGFFPSEKDPFYQLDEGNNSRTEYDSIRTKDGILPPVDLSPVLSNINVLNQSDVYFGKNKYFL